MAEKTEKPEDANAVKQLAPGTVKVGETVIYTGGTGPVAADPNQGGPAMSGPIIMYPSSQAPSAPSGTPIIVVTSTQAKPEDKKVETSLVFKRL